MNIPSTITTYWKNVIHRLKVAGKVSFLASVWEKNEERQSQWKKRYRERERTMNIMTALCLSSYLFVFPFFDDLVLEPFSSLSFPSVYLFSPLSFPFLFPAPSVFFAFFSLYFCFPPQAQRPCHGLSSSFNDLVLGLLKKDPAQRITWQVCQFVPLSKDIRVVV